MNTQSATPVKPNPIAVRQPRGEEEHPNRVLTCNSYSDCCGVAVRKAWPSFSCEKCPMAALAKPMRAEQFMPRDSGINR